MINNDVLIKEVRSRGVLDWPTKVNYIRLHLPELLKGFPGLGLGHLSLVHYEDLLPSDIYIYDPSLYTPADDPSIPAVMIKGGLVFGVGLGVGALRIGDSFGLSLSPDVLVLRVDVRPKETGGPGYYYFYKSKHNYSNEQGKSC